VQLKPPQHRNVTGDVLALRLKALSEWGPFLLSVTIRGNVTRNVTRRIVTNVKYRAFRLNWAVELSTRPPLLVEGGFRPKTVHGNAPWRLSHFVARLARGHSPMPLLERGCLPSWSTRRSAIEANQVRSPPGPPTRSTGHFMNTCGQPHSDQVCPGPGLHGAMPHTPYPCFALCLQAVLRSS
jgi:hypothetical protein